MRRAAQLGLPLPGVAPPRESDRPLARRSDPATSREAARRAVESGSVRGQRWRVLHALLERPGATSAELAHAIGCSRYVTGRRLPDLARDGLVRRGPARDCRIGDGQAITWWPVPEEDSTHG